MEKTTTYVIDEMNVEGDEKVCVFLFVCCHGDVVSFHESPCVVLVLAELKIQSGDGDVLPECPLQVPVFSFITTMVVHANRNLKISTIMASSVLISALHLFFFAAYFFFHLVKLVHYCHLVVWGGWPHLSFTMKIALQIQSIWLWFKLLRFTMIWMTKDLHHNFSLICENWKRNPRRMNWQTFKNVCLVFHIVFHISQDLAFIEH